MTTRTQLLMISIICLGVVGCTSLPDRIEELENAKAEVDAVERNPLARDHAAVRLRKARSALSQAERSFAEKKSLEQIQHEAYLAKQHALIAKQQIDEAKAQERIESGEAKRNNVLLQARTVDVERAEMIAKQRAAEAERANQTAQAAAAEARALEAKLKEMEAEKTERGLVLTLGDVLFDTDKAQLRSAANITVDRLSEFMREYAERRVLIEGHTDSRGSDEYNLDLSQRRADAVRDALLDRGVSSDRIRTRGLGESYPVASNDSSGGKQQNRRVEIVISDQKGEFPVAAERTVQ